MTNYSRLELWRIMTKVAPNFELDHVLAGRRAESFLYALVGQHLKYKGAFCFVSKRVPSAKLKRRFEVDLIVLTKKQIHFFEIKNWSGKLVEFNGNWVQVKRDGTYIEHPNLTHYNSQKTQAMVEYLQSCGVDIPESFISQKVLFMNRNLQIDPVIKEDPDVIPYGQVSQYIKRQKGTSFPESMLHSLIEVCVSSDKSKIILDGLFDAMDKKTLKQANMALSKLSTWDRIHYYGSRVVQGDILELYVNGAKQDLSYLKANHDIKFQWVRRKFKSLLIALFSRNPFGRAKINKRRLPLHPTNDYIKFHCAGDPKPSKIPLRELNGIVKG